MALLDWMDAPPEEPALLGEIDGCKAKDAMLQGVAFRDYLAIEQGPPSAEPSPPPGSIVQHSASHTHSVFAHPSRQSSATEPPQPPLRS